MPRRPLGAPNTLPGSPPFCVGVDEGGVGCMVDFLSTFPQRPPHAKAAVSRPVDLAVAVDRVSPLKDERLEHIAWAFFLCKLSRLLAFLPLLLFLVPLSLKLSLCFLLLPGLVASLQQERLPLHSTRSCR